jgi:hypothetical protein
VSTLDSLKFWKKKEPEAAPEWSPVPPESFDVAPEGTEPMSPHIPQMPMMQEPAMREMPPMMHESPQQNTGTATTVSARDVELILSRLDTIKAQLESLNTRMAHLERIAEGSQPKW